METSADQKMSHESSHCIPHSVAVCFSTKWIPSGIQGQIQMRLIVRLISPSFNHLKDVWVKTVVQAPSLVSAKSYL